MVSPSYVDLLVQTMREKDDLELLEGFMEASARVLWRSMHRHRRNHHREEAAEDRQELSALLQLRSLWKRQLRKRG